MRRLTVVAVAAAAFGLGGCAFHHVEYPDPERPSEYVEFEPDPYWWGAHVWHEHSDDDPWNYAERDD